MHRALQGRCGTFCGDCEIYIAYSTNNIEAQRRIAEKYNKANNCSITPDKVKCLGCKGPAAGCWNGHCKNRACGEERGIEFCYQCREYPCDSLQEFFDHHPEARENLRTISKIGPDAWVYRMLTKDGEKSG